MNRHRLFAAGLSAALLLGVATPAMAKPAKGNAWGHNKSAKPAKPAKDPKAPKAPKAPKSKGHLNGGGTTANGVSFSVQGKDGKLRQAHFNYTSADGATKVRCKGFDQMTRVEYVTVGAPAMHVVSDNCVAKGPGNTRTPVALDATFTDNGATGDTADIAFTKSGEATPYIVDNGAVVGEINVR